MQTNIITAYPIIINQLQGVVKKDMATPPPPMTQEELMKLLIEACPFKLTIIQLPNN